MLYFLQEELFNEGDELMKTIKLTGLVCFLTMAAVAASGSPARAGGTDPYGRDDTNRKILKQGLLGAGTGAIAAGASGGNAGQGALIGAGTNVIGGALLDTLTEPSQPQPAYYQQPVYAAPPPGYAQGGYVQGQQPVRYVNEPPPPQPVYYQTPPPQENSTQKILKQGLLGAGTGAIAAGASGGKAGKGALIGAGTNIIGGALLDAITTPSQPQQPVYYQQPYPQQQSQSYNGQPTQQQQPRKKIIRKYDSEGNVISEEEVYE